MGRRVMAVLAAMMLGLIGVAAVLLYANGADARAIADQRTQSVFITQQLVPSGTTAADAVAKGLMVPTVVAVKGVPVGALTTVDAANGNLVALTDIAAGDFVISSRFGTTPTGEKAIQVPDGQIAISVSLSGPSGVGTFVTPGSRIVIFDTYQATVASPGVAAGAKATRVLLDDVLVIAVGSTSLTPTANANSQAAAGGLVTVAVSPATAPKLVHAIQTGTLYAGLSGTDAKANLGQIVSGATLFSN